MDTPASRQASPESGAKRRQYTRIESFDHPMAPPAVLRRAEWAVIVNHGMGQQLHFETLELVVLALRDAEMRARTQIVKLPAAGGGELETRAQVVPLPVNMRIVKLPAAGGGELELLRAEMEVTDADGRPHSVDLYESYWAPLTES